MVNEAGTFRATIIVTPVTSFAPRQWDECPRGPRRKPAIPYLLTYS